MTWLANASQHSTTPYLEALYPGRKVSMSQLVHVFTVSQSLLFTEGSPDPELIQYCYRMKQALNKHYRQWRILVTPDQLVIKLQTPDGEIVIDDVLDDPEDWRWVLSNSILIWTPAEVMA